ncbi:MAG: pilus assembly protein [Oscillochloris sp.]|nr:pilus assembly protein [Oscillochloris sp.]
MRRRTDGQSLVEMAFVLPVLLIVLFGVIEFGYVIYAYSTISQAARNAAEAGAQLPPYQSWLDYRTQTGLPANYPGFEGDGCVRAMYTAARTDQTLFTDLSQYMTISYPNGSDSRNLYDRGPIQVTISYPLRGITPLFTMFRLGGGSGTITLQVTQRRSLENLGEDPSKVNGVACAQDISNWEELNP